MTTTIAAATRPMTITATSVKPTRCSLVARASARASASAFCLRWALLSFRRYPGGAGRRSRRCGLYAEILGSLRSSIGTSQLEIQSQGAHRYPPLVSRISVVGVPSSAASYAAGQDLAPAALRSTGLLEQLIASGLQVHDDGDLPHQIWSPDRDHPLAQNAGHATTSLQQLADRLHPLLARGDIALVL